ncbi:MAG: hypothetical protein J7M40_03835 [Planctomycetes bacterium]|nr:hypothetical protein [Planctomycetota bacterium]
MTLWQLAKKSLMFFWRTNLGVFLAAMVATMILTGALLVGGSVRHSLNRIVKARLGRTQLALVGDNRFFRAALAEDLADELDAPAAAVMHLSGLITDSGDTKRTGRVQVFGVDKRFYELGPGDDPFGANFNESVVLNEALAARLDVKAGDEVMLRVAKPGLMPRDVPLTPDSDLSIGFRLTVRIVASESQFGRFSLRADQISPYNAFVPLDWLADKTEHTGHANLLLLGQSKTEKISVERADKAIAAKAQLDDFALEVRLLGEQGFIEVRSRRVFIDESLTAPITAAGSDEMGLLTYFVNELRIDPNSTPYSFVTAMSPGRKGGVIPAGFADDEIVINEWLAKDLNAKIGDALTLSYYVAGPMRRLTEQTDTFVVRAIVPMAGIAADAQLMPDFPGLADADDCRDWKPGIKIDLDRIRDKDEEYWDFYRGVPKAFVTLAAGQRMWGNRFGKLTAVRFAAAGRTTEEISSNILQAADPASVGLFFQPVRQMAKRATAKATDIGSLFLGLSMFLIASAVILLGLVFVFGVERRSGQSGLLVAVGFTRKLIRRFYLLEGITIAAGGAAAGAICALLYTAAMLWGLSTVWKSVVGGSVIGFYASPIALLTGICAGVIVSVLAILLTLGRQLRRPASQALAGNLQEQFGARASASRGKWALCLAGVCILAAVIILYVFSKGPAQSASGAFFGSGALLLTAGLAIVYAMLRFLVGRGGRGLRSVGQLALRNTTRRSGRSMAVVALLACGCFLVISIGAFRQRPITDPHKSDSGTGGFAFLGESAVPVLHDLSSPDGRKALGLDENVLKDLHVVQLRLRQGDNANCLNLNRAQRPRLLGVEPQQLQSRFKFIETFDSTDLADGWQLLNKDFGVDIVPAVGDDEMIKWLLGTSVGKDIEYTDERGRTFKLRLVGGLQNSVLQGSLVIAADKFIERFPSQAGFATFLIDADKDSTAAVETAIGRGLSDFGMELTPTAERINDLNAVQNTYLSMFQVLGGLGLVLGSVGLALVVLLNVFERRGELGMLRAVGFTTSTLKRMVLYEHLLLVVAGLAVGVVSALVSITPAITSPGADLPYTMLSVIIAGIAINAVVWICLASTMTMKGNLLDAIRNE